MLILLGEKRSEYSASVSLALDIAPTALNPPLMAWAADIRKNACVHRAIHAVAPWCGAERGGCTGVTWEEAAARAPR